MKRIREMDYTVTFVVILMVSLIMISAVVTIGVLYIKMRIDSTTEAFMKLVASQINEVEEEVEYIESLFMKINEDQMDTYVVTRIVAETLADEDVKNYYIKNLVSIISDKNPDIKASVAMDISETIYHQSEKYKFDPFLIASVMVKESTCDPNVVGSADDTGLMQILPSTGEAFAMEAGVKWNGQETLLDPINNIKIGVTYLDYLRKYFPDNYLVAYNWGETRLRKSLKNGHNYPTHYQDDVHNNYREIVKKDHKDV